MSGLIEKYQAYMRSRDFKPATVESYLRDARLLLAGIGGEEVVSSPDVGEAVSRTMEEMCKKKKDTSMYRWMVSSRKFFDFCASIGLCEGNPMDNVHMQRPPTKKVKRTGSLSMAEQLLSMPVERSMSGLRDRAIVALICSSGLKLTQLRELRVGDFDPLHLLLCMRTGETVRLGQQIALILDEFVACLFLIKHADVNDMMFVSNQGTPLARSSYWKIFKYACHTAGLDESVSAVQMRGSIAAVGADAPAEAKQMALNLSR